MRLEVRFALKRTATSLKWGGSLKGKPLLRRGCRFAPLDPAKPECDGDWTIGLFGHGIQQQKKDAPMGAPLYCFVRNCAHRL